MIVQLPEKYDLCLTYSWCSFPQKMCGHLFECIEYFYILKNHFKCCIFIGEDISLDFIAKTIQDKYIFTEIEIQEILDNIIIKDHPKILKGKNVLITDGNFSKMTDKYLFFDNIMAFPCADTMFKTMNNITMFQDDRIYGKSKCKTINYIKKILLEKYKPIDCNIENVYMLYTTKNARGVLPEELYQLENKFEGKFFLICDEYTKNLSDNFIQEKLPIENLFNKFSTYIYTPVKKKFDCSPRFLVECKYYNKEVIFFNIDYWEEDLGLYWRVYDIENNYESLFLKQDDKIINLIRDIICT